MGLGILGDASGLVILGDGQQSGNAGGRRWPAAYVARHTPGRLAKLTVEQRMPQTAGYVCAGTLR